MSTPSPGSPVPRSALVDVARLVTAYYTARPDPAVREHRVAFGTSGHRGSSLRASFNEAHILATTQAICEYRAERGITGPVLIGKDTHAPSDPAQRSALEVLAANGVEVWYQRDDASGREHCARVPVSTTSSSRSLAAPSAVINISLAIHFLHNPEAQPKNQPIGSKPHRFTKNPGTGKPCKGRRTLTPVLTPYARPCPGCKPCPLAKSARTGSTQDWDWDWSVRFHPSSVTQVKGELYQNSSRLNCWVEEFLVLFDGGAVGHRSGARDNRAPRWLKGEWMRSAPLAAALAAILLWSTLAWLGLALAAWPPLLLVGCALLVGALAGLPRVRD